MATSPVEPSSRAGSFRLKLTLIRYASVVLLALLVGAGTAYYNNVSNQRSYYTERNFRLLSTIREELNEYLINYEKVFRSIAHSTLPKRKDKEFTPENNSCLKEGVGRNSQSGGPSLKKDVWETYVTALCTFLYNPKMHNVVIEVTARTHTISFPAKRIEESGVALAIHTVLGKNSIQAKEQSGPVTLSTDKGGTIELPAESEKKLDHTFEVSLKQRSEGAVAVLDFRQPLTGTVNGKRYDLHILAEVKLEDILNELPVDNMFAHLLLADESGNILFEKKDSRRPSALEFTSLDVLFSKELSSAWKTVSPSSSVTGGEKGKSQNPESDSHSMLLTMKLPAL